MKKLTYILGLISLITILSCNNNEPNTKSLGAYELNEDYSVNNKVNLEEVEIERKLIKDGNLEFQVENIKNSRQNILKAVKENNGYISSDKEFKNSNELSSLIVVRVKANKFDSLLDTITKGIENFDKKEISIKDVTEEYLDIESRLKTKKELENRYLEILKKAKTVKEILEVEREIGNLRTEIESIEGRLKYLENRVSYSTLNIRIYEKISKKNEFGNKFKNGFKNGWNNLIMFFVFLVNIWPFIVLLTGLFIFIKYLRKKRLNKNNRK